VNQSDVTAFGSLLDDLNQAGVRYVLVGGIAVIRHGVVRGTRDIDAVFAPDDANVERIGQLVTAWHATRQDGSPLPADAIGPGRSVHLRTRSVGRERDLADLSDLREAHGELPGL